jgi:hypothetical protein
MTNREHQPGHRAALDLEHLRDAGRKPYPLGIPDRLITKAHEDHAKAIAAHAKAHPKPAPLVPTANACLRPSDVPGVLIAAGIGAVIDSLARIERAKGPLAAEYAYLDIFERALRDGHTTLCLEMTRAREQIVMGREAMAEARRHDQRRRMANLAAPDPTPRRTENPYMRDYSGTTLVRG